MEREFRVASYGKCLCAETRRKFSFPILIIFVWALTLCSPSVAKASSPAVRVSATSIYFGSYSVGTKGGPENLSVTNSGKARLTINSITLTGANAGDFARTNNCGASLAAGASCLVQVMFKPSAPGNRTTVLNIKDNATGSPQKVTFSGTGTAVAAVANLSPASLTFASQAVGATSASQAIALTNSGGAALTISSLTITGANASDFAQTNSCGSSVAAGANCKIGVTFKPTAAGTRIAAITISDSATGSPQTVRLSGTGTSTTDSASLSPSTLTFPSEPVQMTSTGQTVTLTNTSTTSLSISSFTVTGGNASDFVQNNNCGSAVASGATCTIVVLFTPSATGARAAALSISDSSTGSPQTVSLSGTGCHDVILSWTASSTPGVMGYNIYRGTASGGETVAPLNSTPINGTGFTDATVTAGVTYYYRATSVTSDGITQSAASAETSTTVPSP